MPETLAPNPAVAPPEIQQSTVDARIAAMEGQFQDPTAVMQGIENGVTPTIKAVDQLAQEDRAQAIDALLEDPELTATMDEQVQSTLETAGDIEVGSETEPKDGLQALEERKLIQDITADLLDATVSD